MKRLLKFFSALKRLYVTSAPAGAAVPYVLGLIFVFFYFVDHTHPDEAYLICGAVMFLAGLFIQIGCSVNRGINGTPADYLSDYDKDVIGTAFMYGEKKRMFYSALELLLAENNYNDALDIFRDLKGKSLTDSEQGVLGFYTSICYSRMGYSTNAAHCAVIAAEKEIHLPESLLMAARNFSLSASYGSAAEYYEKLVPIAESKGIFPFIYNEIGRMFLSANLPEKSRYYFEKSIEYGLDPITSQGGLALASLLEGKEDEACERYRLALIARIGDMEGFKSYCAQICTAGGYPENFFEEHLRERYGKADSHING